MKRALILLWSFAVMATLLTCAVLFLALRGSHAVYNGLRVARQTQWYVYSLTIPIPTSRAAVYYAYQDATGAWIREGPCVEYYQNGNLRLVSNYLHGELDATQSVFNEYGIETLRFYWAQGKMVREVRCPCVGP